MSNAKIARCTGLVLIALGALMPTGALAAGLKLETAGRGILPAGAEIWGASRNLTFVTSKGSVRCPLSQFFGSLEPSKSASAHIFAAFPSFYHELTQCESSLPAGPGWEVPESGFIPVSLRSNEYWTIDMTTNGRFVIRGKGGPAGRVVFEFPSLESGECIYESRHTTRESSDDEQVPNSIEGRFAIGAATEVAFTHVHLVRAPKSNSQCPRSARLEATFSLHSGEELLTTSL